MATLAPERASSTASACPIPEPAPVTTATFPANPCMSTLPVGWLVGSRLTGTAGPGCTGFEPAICAQSAVDVCGPGIFSAPSDPRSRIGGRRQGATMNDDPSTDVVTRQYERWKYPRPIENLEGWIVARF